MAKARGTGDNGAKILKFLENNPGEHNRAAVEKGTRLTKGGVISALRVLREDGKINVRKDGTHDKAPLFYSAKK